MIALGTVASSLLWLGGLVVIHVAPDLNATERLRLFDAQAGVVLLGSGWIVIVRCVLEQWEVHRHRLVRRIRGPSRRWVVQDVARLSLSLFALAPLAVAFTFWRNFDPASLLLRSSVFWPVVGLTPGLVGLSSGKTGLVCALAAVVCSHIGMLGGNFPLGSATVSTFDPSSARWLADGTAGIASLFVSLALARSRPN